MTDRLGEIKKYQLDEIHLEIQGEEEQTPGHVEKQEEQVLSFFNVVGEIKKRLQTIQIECSTLDRKYAESMVGIKAKTDGAEDRRLELDVLRENISNNLNWIKTQLERVNKENKKVSEDEGVGSAEYRIRTNQYNQLQVQFQERVQEFARVQNDYKQKQEDTLKRHIKIVNSNATDEEVERMLSDPSVELDQLFSNAIIGSSALHTRDAIYNRVKETRDDLLKLEDSMNELVELFRDLNTLVNSQQGLIDNIERNVTTAANYVERGAQHTKEAKKYQGKSRIMFFVVMGAGLCLILLIVAIVLIVTAIVLPAVLATRPR